MKLIAGFILLVLAGCSKEISVEYSSSGEEEGKSYIALSIENTSSFKIEDLRCEVAIYRNSGAIGYGYIQTTLPVEKKDSGIMKVWLPEYIHSETDYEESTAACSYLFRGNTVNTKTFYCPHSFARRCST